MFSKLKKRKMKRNFQIVYIYTNTYGVIAVSKATICNDLVTLSHVRKLFLLM